MDKFLYVFCMEDRDKLLSLGYSLLKSDERNSIYIFETKESFKIDVGKSDYILSNTLTF